MNTDTENTQGTEDIEDVTAQVIHDMLTERTGIHMMDSGGSCGRHWQRNHYGGCREPIRAQPFLAAHSLLSAYLRNAGGFR